MGSLPFRAEVSTLLIRYDGVVFAEKLNRYTLRMEHKRNTPLIFHPNRLSLVKSLIGSILFVFLSIWMVLTSFESYLYPSLLVKGAGYAGSLLFSFSAVFSLIRSIRKDLAVIVDERGICDNATGVGANWISWDEILDVHVIRLADSNYVCIIPKDKEAFLSRFSWLGRVLRIGPPLSIAAFAISADLFNVNAETLCDQITAYQQDLMSSTSAS